MFFFCMLEISLNNNNNKKNTIERKHLIENKYMRRSVINFIMTYFFCI